MAKKKLSKSKAKKARKRVSSSLYTRIIPSFLRLLPAMLILGALFILARGAIWMLLNSEYFYIKEVKVFSERNGILAPSDYVKVEIGEAINIFKADIKKYHQEIEQAYPELKDCLLYTSPSPRDRTRSRMPSSA